MKTQTLAIANGLNAKINQLKSQILVLHTLIPDNSTTNPPSFTHVNDEGAHSYYIPETSWKTFLKSELKRLRKELALTENEFKRL